MPGQILLPAKRLLRLTSINENITCSVVGADVISIFYLFR